MATLLRTLPILLLLLPGCAESPATDEGARAWLQVATDTARRVDDGARLLGIAGLEAQDADAALALLGDQGAEWMRLWARDDRGPADGRLPAWLYAFLGTGDPVYVVVADGRVVFADRVDREAARQDVVRLGAPGDWTVDTPAARTALLEAGVLPDGPVVWQLARDEDGGAAWRAASPGSEAAHEVDALAGTVHEVLEDEEEGEAHTATVTVTSPRSMHAFEKEGDDAVRARVELVDPLPMTLVELRLVAPDGTGHAVVADGDQDGTAMLEVPVAPAGGWDVGVLLVRGVSAEVRLAWCTFEDEGDEGEVAGDDVLERCRSG